MRLLVKKIIFLVADIVLLPFTLLLLPFIKWIRRYGVEYFPLYRKSFLAIEIFPIRDHFTNPVSVTPLPLMPERNANCRLIFMCQIS